MVDWCGGRWLIGGVGVRLIGGVGSGRLVRWEVVDWWGERWLNGRVGGG